MAISKDSIRVQFTLNTSKEKENEIAKFLDGCINPNVTIKEIIFNYIVTHRDVQLPQVNQLEVPQSISRLVKVSNCDNNMVSDSDSKLVKVSNCEGINELQQNELDELSKFLL